ncbi:hypothetical protein CAEBREN_17168 [Caenorhabditis brenneri]|uniref:Regulatory protein zeste n=1 Tax=Caenorhabditis brenneri TaxID=135651 RepID=G0NMC9_CAEBE|nr:hypothetical protein CAEBREN_17168 [Caenorhabditis brenneri]
METSQPKRAANRKEKSASFPEDAAYRLVQLFIRDEEKYNERRTGGSNKGKQARQICLEKWQEELAAMGCHRTTEQIYARIRGDLIHIRSVLTEETAERGKTGGGKAKKSKKLDTARSMLYEHMEGSHTVLGISGGLEC